MVTGVRNTVEDRVSQTLESKQAGVVVVKTRQLVQSLLAAILTTSLVVSLAIFLYATFYHAYMPVEVHEENLELQFQPCDTKPALCSFPNASWILNRNKKQLMAGQPYSVALLLEVPDSPTNQGLGMFQSCVTVGTIRGARERSCRSSILEYRSEMLRFIETMVLSPLFLTGVTTQRQWVRVNYFTDFQDDPSSPTTDFFLEIQSKFIQVYSAKMEIHAQLSGLRHLMYHHPWVSSVTGILANILTLSIIILMSWSRFLGPELEMEQTQKTEIQKEGKERDVILEERKEGKIGVETVGWK